MEITEGTIAIIATVLGIVAGFFLGLSARR